jgi:hypothetical protein
MDEAPRFAHCAANRPRKKNGPLEPKLARAEHPKETLAVVGLEAP